MRNSFAVLLLLPALAFAAGQPEVYKWTDKDGVVHYTDKPPSDTAAPAKLPPLQTYKGGTAPPDLTKFDKGARPGKPAAGIYQVQVVTPAADETFRSTDRTVPVAVMVSPALQDGHRLIYLLDGTPDSTPTSNTSHAFTGVDRGSHSAAVTLVDEDGAEIGRSNTVTFHVKPPQVKRAP
jgi:hypothetical protein